MAETVRSGGNLFDMRRNAVSLDGNDRTRWPLAICSVRHNYRLVCLLRYLIIGVIYGWLEFI